MPLLAERDGVFAPLLPRLRKDAHRFGKVHVISAATTQRASMRGALKEIQRLLNRQQVSSIGLGVRAVMAYLMGAHWFLLPLLHLEETPNADAGASREGSL